MPYKNGEKVLLQCRTYLPHAIFAMYHSDTSVLIISINNINFNNFNINNYILFFPLGPTRPIVGVYFTALYRASASSHTRLLDHTATHHSR